MANKEWLAMNPGSAAGKTAGYGSQPPNSGSFNSNQYQNPQMGSYGGPPPDGAIRTLPCMTGSRASPRQRPHGLVLPPAIRARATPITR